jgi:hypothetical protein
LLDGTLHHFSAGGLYNGLVLLIDDETRTYWDHITGAALHGPLAGRRLETWSVAVTTVAAALKDSPDITVSLSGKMSLRARLFSLLHRRTIGTRGFLPPLFLVTMGKADDRLPRMAQGLGVAEAGRARFYPAAAIGTGIQDSWDGRTLRVAFGPVDGVPFAGWEDGGRPFQMFTRWYGFSYTFPGCEIFPRRGPGLPRGSPGSS